MAKKSTSQNKQNNSKNGSKDNGTNIGLNKNRVGAESTRGVRVNTRPPKK